MEKVEEIRKEYYEVKQKSWKEKLWFFLKIYFIIFSAVGFTMFICEECMQTAMFGSFAYNSAKDVDGLENHINTIMKPTAHVSKIIIRGLGWLNPLMYPAYNQYLKVNDGYIKSAESEARAMREKEKSWQNQ